MPTKDEMVAQAAIQNSQEEKKKFAKSRLYNATKITILVISVLVLVIGILGSMHWGVFSSFAMADYVSFIESYRGIFITLIASIGAGGGLKNIAKAITEKKTGSDDDGEDLVKGGNP